LDVARERCEADAAVVIEQDTDIPGRETGCIQEGRATKTDCSLGSLDDKE